ncbi:hypothetical protein C8R43DRAFT_951100 [Mycena crocata]|nr:hypothetical protein C8R43DRAFT_951100 [Mycena crocata]
MAGTEAEAVTGGTASSFTRIAWLTNEVQRPGGRDDMRGGAEEGDVAPNAVAKQTTSEDLEDFMAYDLSSNSTERAEEENSTIACCRVADLSPTLLLSLRLLEPSRWKLQNPNISTILPTFNQKSSISVSVSSHEISGNQGRSKRGDLKLEHEFTVPCPLLDYEGAGEILNYHNPDGEIHCMHGYARTGNSNSIAPALANSACAAAPAIPTQSQSLTPVNLRPVSKWVCVRRWGLVPTPLDLFRLDSEHTHGVCSETPLPIHCPVCEERVAAAACDATCRHWYGTSRAWTVHYIGTDNPRRGQGQASGAELTGRVRSEQAQRTGAENSHVRLSSVNSQPSERSTSVFAALQMQQPTSVFAGFQACSRTRFRAWYCTCG